MSDDDVTPDAIAGRLRSARSTEHRLPAPRLDEMIAAGALELRGGRAIEGQPDDDPVVAAVPTIDVSTAGSFGPPTEGDNEVALEAALSSSAGGTRVRPAALALVAAAAAIVLSFLVIDRDEAPQPVEVASEAADSSLSIAWLGVSPDERTPERAVLGGHRLQMNAREVMLIWAEAGHDNDRTDVVYELRRLRVGSGVDPKSLMTVLGFAAGDLRYTGRATRYLDEDVEEGAEYVYGVVASSSSGAGLATWRSEIFAVTDTAAPAMVTDLALDNSFSLVWGHPALDEVTLFEVLRRDGDTYTRLGTAYSPSTQLSLTDSKPVGQELFVVAVDAHGNASTPALVTLDD